MSAAAPAAEPRGFAGYSPRVRLRRGLSIAFLIAALIAIAIGVVMLGALIVEIRDSDGAARLFTDGGPVEYEARRGGTFIDDGTPSGMRWMTWALPLAVLLPFVLPRILHTRIELTQASNRFLGLLVVAPAAVFLHLLYIRFEAAYLIDESGHIFSLFGDASGFQIVRLVIVGCCCRWRSCSAAGRGPPRCANPR